MGVAGLYVFLGADFPAVAQVLIYVGGVLVLILFAIMLTKQIGEDPKLTNAHLALPVGAGLALRDGAPRSRYMAVMAPWKLTPAPRYLGAGAAPRLGIAFLTDYLLPFEVASVVLLAALIGAVSSRARRSRKTWTRSCNDDAAPVGLPHFLIVGAAALRARAWSRSSPAATRWASSWASSSS